MTERSDVIIPAAPSNAAGDSLDPLGRWQWRIVVEDYDDEWIENTLEEAISRVSFEMRSCANKIHIERTRPSTVPPQGGEEKATNMNETPSGLLAGLEAALRQEAVGIVGVALKAGRGIGRAAAQMEVIDKEEWSKIFREQLDEMCKENDTLFKALEKLMRVAYDEANRIANHCSDGAARWAMDNLYNAANEAQEVLRVGGGGAEE